MPRVSIVQKLAPLAALALLTLVGAGLRLRGIAHGLPVAVEQDCKIPYQVELLERRDARWTTDAEFRWYPLLVAQVASLAPNAEPAPQEAPLDQHLATASQPHVQVRACVALLASLVIPATYFLARRFAGPWAALFAAALVATSLLDLNFSQQSRPHAVAGFTFLAGVLGALRLRRRGDASGFGLAGLGAAAAVGTLQSGVAVLPALGVAFALRARRGRRWLDWRAVVALLPLALAVPFFYPFAIWGEPTGTEASARVAQSFLEFHAGERWEIDVGDHRIFLDQFTGDGFAALGHALWSYDPALLALGALGVVAWLARGRIARAAVPRERKRDFAVAATFALPYLAVFGLYERTYERFAIPLLPFLACCAAFGASEIARRWPSLARASIAAPAAALALALPAFGAWKLGEIRSAPHTTALAADWVHDHAERTDDVALWPQLDLPLFRAPEGLVSWLPGGIERSFTWVWSRYQARLPRGHGPEPMHRLRWWTPKLKQMADEPETYVREQGGDFVVIEVYAQDRNHPGATRVREALRGSAELVARFSPDSRPGYSEHPLGYQDETSVAPPHFLARVLQARRTGPVIEIYRRAAD